MSRSVFVQFVRISCGEEKPGPYVTVRSGLFPFLSAAGCTTGAPRSNPRRDHRPGSLPICGGTGGQPDPVS